MRTRRMLAALSIVSVLALGVAALMVGGTTETSAGMAVQVEDASAELALLDAGTIDSVGFNCMYCPDNVGVEDCEPVGQCGTCGEFNRCSCSYCGGNWGCWKFGTACLTE